ncbi:hypothetical protein PoB_001759000 [Plakobranchus ocellatus]|uniref:Uncharacterized protein n=1 Tax=Plakobranchus ocellatus TaxID=259542 RepID=A0AAV3Z6H9_9GAST|nr:hypothetical protein PoB_001759000 [Plakobranchus ocellatus]
MTRRETPVLRSVVAPVAIKVRYGFGEAMLADAVEVLGFESGEREAGRVLAFHRCAASLEILPLPVSKILRNLPSVL